MLSHALYTTDETAEDAGRTGWSGSEVPGSRFTAALYDPFVWLGERRGMRSRRRRLLAGARGRVLEIGAGTGLNVEHYPDGIETLVLAEPVEPMAAKIEVGDRRGSTPVSVVRARGEELPFADDSFDTVVSTLVLCTVEDVERTLAEIRRVLAPGGKLLFLEHVRSDSERWGRWQDRLARPWAAWAEGCRCDRNTLESIGEAFSVQRLEREKWNGMPAVVRPLIIGEAVA